MPEQTIGDKLEAAAPGVKTWLDNHISSISSAKTLAQAKTAAEKLKLHLNACIHYDDGTIVCRGE